MTGHHYWYTKSIDKLEVSTKSKRINDTVDIWNVGVNTPPSHTQADPSIVQGSPTRGCRRLPMGSSEERALYSGQTLIHCHSDRYVQNLQMRLLDHYVSLRAVLWLSSSMINLKEVITTVLCRSSSNSIINCVMQLFGIFSCLARSIFAVACCVHGFNDNIWKGKSWSSNVWILQVQVNN